MWQGKKKFLLSAVNYAVKKFRSRKMRRRNRLRKLVDLCGMCQFVALFMVIPIDGYLKSRAC